MTKLLVMTICFITMEVGSCKTPWSRRDRRLYLRTSEELDKALTKLAEYKRKEQELIDLQQEELLKDEPMYIEEEPGAMDYVEMKRNTTLMKKFQLSILN